MHAPAGLDIGADGAEEVATAIIGEILAVMRGRGVPYLGVLGPRDRTDRLLAELEAPPSEADLAALHAPAGLDIGADGAEEVATAIIGEILAVLRGRGGSSLRERSGPIHG